MKDKFYQQNPIPHLSNPCVMLVPCRRRQNERAGVGRRSLVLNIPCDGPFDFTEGHSREPMKITVSQRLETTPNTKKGLRVVNSHLLYRLSYWGMSLQGRNIRD